MVSDLSIVALAGQLFGLSWSSDEPGALFRIYRDGSLLTTTRATTITTTVAQGEFPIFEVLDDTEGDPQRGHPSRLTLGWYVDGAVASYAIQQLVSSQWITRKTLSNLGATAFMAWISDVIADQENVQFRVIPTGSNGNPGGVAQIAALMVRYPDPPSSARFSYDAGSGKVTIQ